MLKLPNVFECSEKLSTFCRIESIRNPNTLTPRMKKTFFLSPSFVLFFSFLFPSFLNYPSLSYLPLFLFQGFLLFFSFLLSCFFFLLFFCFLTFFYMLVLCVTSSFLCVYAGFGLLSVDPLIIECTQKGYHHLILPSLKS